MSGLEELRQRVMDAEKRFGLNDAQRAKYGERLIVLMNAVEGRIHEQQDHIAQQAQEIETLKAAGGREADENEQLRTMLHSLLQAIESGGGDGLVEAMQELDRKASVLVSTTEESSEQIDEPPVGTAIAVGPVSVGPIEEIEEAAEPDPEPAIADEIEAEAEAETGIEEAAIAESASEEIEEPVAEETAEPAAEAEAETPAAEEIEEPVAEEIAESASEEIAEPVTGAEEPAVEAAAPDAAPEDALPGGSLDEIMERVSKLVEETEAAAEDSAEDSAEEIAEEPAQLATGTDS